MMLSLRSTVVVLANILVPVTIRLPVIVTLLPNAATDVTVKLDDTLTNPVIVVLPRDAAVLLTTELTVELPTVILPLDTTMPESPR